MESNFLMKHSILPILIIQIFSIFYCKQNSELAIKGIIPLPQAQESNALELTNLTLSSGTLSPTFSSRTNSYTATVLNSVSTITITPTANDSNATITVNGNITQSGTSSVDISLNIGANTITILLTKATKTSATYTVVVTRQSPPSTTNTLSNLIVSAGTLSPTFSSATNTYTMTLANSVSSITLTPTATDSTSTITVNGTSVNSGVASNSISLIVGANAISIIVTSASGTTNTYNLTVTRLNNTTYRIFISTSSYNGNLGGIAGADSKCNADPNKPNDGSTYKAIVVDNSGVQRRACTSGNCTNVAENIDWALRVNTIYVRSSDSATILTTNTAGIFAFGTLTNAFKSGAQVQFWTGLRSDWQSSSNDCNDWSSSSSGNNGRYGLSDATDSNAIRSGTTTCDNTAFLFCAEQ